MTVSNIFSKATGPVVTNIHIELPGAEGRKVCSNMVAMPAHGKNSGPIALKFDT